MRSAVPAPRTLPSQSTGEGVGTLQEMVAAIDRALPLCEALSKAPADREARQALYLALAAIADESFVEPCQEAPSALRGLCNFVHIQAMLLRGCLTRSDEPGHVIQFAIDSKARDLLALLPELKRVIERHAV
jgi:hypothetical protein